MKKIKFLSSLLEQDPASLGDLSKGTDGLKQPTANQPANNSGTQNRRRRNNTEQDVPQTASAEAAQRAKEPNATLLKLPGSGMHGETGTTISSKLKDGTMVGSEVWPWAVYWVSTGGEAYNPATKTPIKTDKEYIFNTVGEQKVFVQWKKAQFEVATLYSGTYTIGNGKISITGNSGQSEIIDIASGKIDKSNVAVVPASEEELNDVMGKFSRITPTFSWYWYMKMFNLRTENAGLRQAILDGLTAAGYNPYPAGSNVIDKHNMIVNIKEVRSRATKGFSFWPVTNLFYSQFAPGKDEVIFGSIGNISSPVHSPVKSGKKDFTSGYEYLAYKLEGAARGSSNAGSSEHSRSVDWDSDDINTVFDDDEALGFFAILAGLSSGVVDKLNEMSKTGLYALPNGSWSQTVLDEVGYDAGDSSYYKEIYTKYISSLATNGGTTFKQESIVSLYPTIENTRDAQWFKSAAELYGLGGTYLADALKTVPKYIAPKVEPHVVK
jgi:hypothetical protein